MNRVRRVWNHIRINCSSHRRDAAAKSSLIKCSRCFVMLLRMSRTESLHHIARSSWKAGSSTHDFQRTSSSGVLCSPPTALCLRCYKKSSPPTPSLHAPTFGTAGCHSISSKRHDDTSVNLAVANTPRLQQAPSLIVCWPLIVCCSHINRPYFLAAHEVVTSTGTLLGIPQSTNQDTQLKIPFTHVLLG